MNAKLVQFEDGTFGVRRWSILFFGYAYLDFRSQEFWWPKGSTYMADCHASRESAVRAYSIRFDKGEPVKETP